MMGFWDAVASAGPHANNLHLTPVIKPHNHLNFHRPDALPDAQPTAPKIQRQCRLQRFLPNPNTLVASMRVATISVKARKADIWNYTNSQRRITSKKASDCVQVDRVRFL